MSSSASLFLHQPWLVLPAHVGSGESAQLFRAAAARTLRAVCTSWTRAVRRGFLFGLRAFRTALGLRSQRVRSSAAIVLASLLQTRLADDTITFHDLGRCRSMIHMVEHSVELRLVIVFPVAPFFLERRLSSRFGMAATFLSSHSTIGIFRMLICKMPQYISRRFHGRQCGMNHGYTQIYSVSALLSCIDRASVAPGRWTSTQFDKTCHV